MSCDVERPVQKGELSFDPPRLVFFCCQQTTPLPVGIRLTSRKKRRHRKKEKQKIKEPPRATTPGRYGEVRKTWRTTSTNKRECHADDMTIPERMPEPGPNHHPQPMDGWPAAGLALLGVCTACVNHSERVEAAFDVTGKGHWKITQLCVLAECMSRHVCAQPNQRELDLLSSNKRSPQLPHVLNLEAWSPPC